MRRRRIPSLIALGALAAIYAPSARAQDNRQTTIEIDYSTTADRLRPEPSSGVVTDHHLTVTLSNGNHVDESRRSHSGAYNGSWDHATVLGQEGGGPKFRVLGPNRLGRVVDFPAGVETVTITTSDASCRIEVVYRLKAGAGEWIQRRLKNNEIAYWTLPRVTSSSCSIR